MARSKNMEESFGRSNIKNLRVTAKDKQFKPTILT